MALSFEEVERIAKLARLSFSDAEKQKLQTELGSILDYVNQVQKVVDKTEEIYNPEALNLMRDDFAETSITPEELLKQAPEREDNFVKVKSILE